LVVDFDAAPAHVRTSWNQDCAEINKLAGSEFVIWHLVLSFRRLAREGAASAALFVCGQFPAVIDIVNPAHPKTYLDALHPKAGALETTREHL
jgi:hypothetical protein